MGYNGSRRNNSRISRAWLMLKTPKVPQGAVVRRQARSKAPGASTTHKTQHVGAYAYATEREEADKGGEESNARMRPLRPIQPDPVNNEHSKPRINPK